MGAKKMTEIIIKSIEELDERHELEFSHLENELAQEIENTTGNKKSAKARAKKKKDAMRKRQEDEKAKFLFSEEDEITLEVLNLTVEEPVKREVEEKEETEPKVSKTAKRRAKKAQQEREKQDRIKAALAESEARFLAGERGPKQ